MRRAVGNPVPGNTPIQLPDGKRFCAFTIGPESQYDQLLVDGRLVCAGRVTWFPDGADSSARVSYSRGPLSPPGGTDSKWIAELLAFECAAEVDAKPRPPREFNKSQAGVATAQISSTVGADNTLAFTLVVPFVGRRAARVSLTAVGARAEWVVFGRKWFPPTIDGQATQPGAAGAGTVAYTGSGAPIAGFRGSKEWPLSGTIAAPRLAARSDIVTATPSGAWLADAIDIGGTDSFSSCDELVIQWQKYTPDAASALDVYVDVCVLGEEGAG